MLVVDPKNLNVGLSYELSGKKLRIIYDGIELNNVQGVWYRKPVLPKADELPLSRSWDRTASAGLLERFYKLITAHFPEANKVSDYYAMQRASQKTLQLLEASKLGLAVPDTLVTSDIGQAKNFLSTHHDVVVKSLLASMGADKNGNLIAVPTTRIDANTINLRGLQYSPAIFQVAIKPKMELRITVVGDRVFTAAIDNFDTDNVIRDWRYVYSKQKSVSFVPYNELPLQTEKLFVGLVRQLKLNYAAIDVIIDEDCKLWFLELNTNGQWQFIEEDTGLLISQAIADELIQNKRMQPVW